MCSLHCSFHAALYFLEISGISTQSFLLRIQGFARRDNLIGIIMEVLIIDRLGFTDWVRSAEHAAVVHFFSLPRHPTIPPSHHPNIIRRSLSDLDPVSMPSLLPSVQHRARNAIENGLSPCESGFDKRVQIRCKVPHGPPWERDKRASVDLN